jgi:hypothetical protein
MIENFVNWDDTVSILGDRSAKRVPFQNLQATNSLTSLQIVHQDELPRFFKWLKLVSSHNQITPTFINKDRSN